MDQIASASMRALRVPRNVRNQMSGYRFLRSLNDEEAKLAFFDPQYRGDLEHLNYGNEGERQKARAALPQMSDEMIRDFVEEIERVLRPSGHLMLWVNKFSVGSGHHLRYFARTRLFKIVDVIHWDKMRMGMGYRSRATAEYLVVVQKAPIVAKGAWNDRGIKDSWFEMSDPTVHTHAKPVLLTERLIRATTNRGDLVIDPAAGGYGVLNVCQRTRREFAGADIFTDGEPPAWSDEDE